MAGGPTYTPIATTTLGSAAASYTFSSIPSTYTDLVVVFNGTAASTTALGIQFNSDTGTNYSCTVLRGTGTGADSYRASSQTLISVDHTVTSTDGVAIINIMNYANSTTYKTVLTRNGAATSYVQTEVGLWRSTSAINTIKLSAVDGTGFNTGTSFSLYGIASA